MRKAYVVQVDLPDPPAFLDNDEHALSAIQGILANHLPPSCDPSVYVAPDSLQPSSTSRGINNS